MSDYSQNGEQEHILRFFGDKPGRFLDLGAHDGIEGSNTRCLSDRYWHGVLVEANPRTFVKLLQNHEQNEKMWCVNGAIMDRPGLFEFYDTGSQVSTAMADNGVGRWVQKKYTVAAFTPDMLAAQFGMSFDFVSIDVEGVDRSVVSQCGNLLLGTRLLCVEDSIPCKGFDPDYYHSLMSICAELGFKKVWARTSAPDGSPANTLLTRE